MSTPTHVGSMTFTKPSDTVLVATRVIEAPRDLVWAAHTECAHVKEWLLGPEGWTMPICEIDLRPGGQWRYVYQGPSGDGFQMSGEYRDVRAPELLVNTEKMEGVELESLNTLELIEDEDRTIVRTTVEYPSKDSREEIIATGMMDGWAESYDRLDRYLRTAM